MNMKYGNVKKWKKNNIYCISRYFSPFFFEQLNLSLTEGGHEFSSGFKFCENEFLPHHLVFPFCF